MQITFRYFWTVAAMSSAARLCSEDTPGIIRFITFSSSLHFSQPNTSAIHQRPLPIFFFYFSYLFWIIFAMLFLLYLDNKYYYSSFLPLFHPHHKPCRKLSPGLWNTSWKDKTNPDDGGKAEVEQSAPKVLPHLTILFKCDILQKNPLKIPLKIMYT